MTRHPPLRHQHCFPGMPCFRKEFVYSLMLLGFSYFVWWSMEWKRATNHHCCQQATLSLSSVSSSNEVCVGSSRTGRFGAPKANEPREERRKYEDLATLRKECVHLVPIIKYVASGIKSTKPNPTKTVFPIIIIFDLFYFFDSHHSFYS